MARQVISDLRKAHPEQRVECQVGENLVATADPQLLRVVLENLLGNAWKYTQKTTAPNIALKGLKSNNDKKCFIVSDNGVGIKAEYAKQIFTPFQRLHAEQEFPGLGIGLATVAKIVARHNGKIWVEGAEGKGAIIKVCL